MHMRAVSTGRFVIAQKASGRFEQSSLSSPATTFVAYSHGIFLCKSSCERKNLNVHR